jgi:uncharacterized protein (DUF433 family)
MTARIEEQRQQLFKASAVIDMCRYACASKFEGFDPEQLAVTLHVVGDLICDTAEALERLAALRLWKLPTLDWRARIGTDSSACHGKACIKGTRIMVSAVLSNLANGKSADEVVQLYPVLRREDVAAAMFYAAELARERVLPFDATGT